jgi:hypothetical protein
MKFWEEFMNLTFLQMIESCLYNANKDYLLIYCLVAHLFEAQF